MTGKRSLKRRLESIEDDETDALTLEDVMEWITAINNDTDVGRPQSYFSSLEWSDSLLEIHEKITARAPELAHVTPAEAYALSYMDEGTADRVAAAINENPPEGLINDE